MTIVNLGSMSVGVAVPGAATAVTTGTVGINTALPDITARLAALAAFVPGPVDFAAQAILAAQTAASVQLAITGGLPVPSLDAQIAIVTAAMGVLEAYIASVNAQLSILAGFTAPLAHAGIGAYAYDGALGSFGSELGAAIGASGTHANALALVTTDPAAWTALSAIMKVAP